MSVDMKYLLRRMFRIVFWFFALIGFLVTLWMILAVIHWSRLFRDNVTLPNGLVLKREFDFSRSGRDDMFAADGKTLLARDIEFVCFNDRFVWVYSYERGYSGMYDARTGRRVLGEEAQRDSGLFGGHGCNGYYTGMLGAGLLYDGLQATFLPPCSWRNLDREGLSDRSWFDRPCREDDRWDRNGP